jgi:hypothetical protein
MPVYVYVHAPGVTNIWHYSKNCRDYPSDPQGKTTGRPTGLLCEKCKAMELDTNCRP